MKEETIAIIPAYNEEEHLAQIIARVRLFVSQIIVVNDGSTDGTAKAAESADVVLHHLVNGGKGVALQTGFSYVSSSGAKYIVTIDADDQHDPKYIPQLIEKMRETGASIVVGARAQGGNMPFVFKFGNLFLNKSFEYLFKNKISDTQSGYRLFLAEDLEKLGIESQGYEVETEILAKAGKMGLKITEIPIDTKYHNTYKGTTVLDGLRIFGKMLSWKIMR